MPQLAINMSIAGSGGETVKRVVCVCFCMGVRIKKLQQLKCSLGNANTYMATYTLIANIQYLVEYGDFLL